MIKTCFMLVAIFVVCHLPVIVILEIRAVHDSSENTLWDVIELVAAALALFNSGINCVIYAWWMPQFRAALQQVLCGSCGKCRNMQQMTTSGIPTLSRSTGLSSVSA